MDYLALGKRIRATRLQMRFTQEMLAERSGISVSFLGHIERGTRKASLETIVSLSNALQITPDALLRDSIRFPVDAQAIPQLTEKKQLIIKEVMRTINDVVDNWEY